MFNEALVGFGNWSPWKTFVFFSSTEALRKRCDLKHDKTSDDARLPSWQPLPSQPRNAAMEILIPAIWMEKMEKSSIYNASITYELVENNVFGFISDG